jgi:hypothetical protein
MIEFFDVPPAEDEAFLAAWSSAATTGATLHQALREDVQPRFAALDPGGPGSGVLLLVSFDGDAAAWRPVFDAWRPRQGFIDADVSGDVAVVHWSSPLMYARAVDALGDLVALLPFPTRAGLYRRTTRTLNASGTDRTPCG